MTISELYGVVNPITSVPQGQGDVSPAKPAGHSPGGPTEFQKILDNQLHYSRHAETRIKSRAINWNEAIENRVLKGVESAQSKGSRETLILADNIAVIANVKSRTIITAMDSSQLKEPIFTNIDSAVLV